jgi:hypothetical protein
MYRCTYLDRDLLRFFTLPLWGRINDIFSHLHDLVYRENLEKEMSFDNCPITGAVLVMKVLKKTGKGT